MANQATAFLSVLWYGNVALPEIIVKSLGSTSGQVYHLKLASYHTYGAGQKNGPQTLDHNSVKSILIFSLEDSFIFSSVLARRAKYMTLCCL